LRSTAQITVLDIKKLDQIKNGQTWFSPFMGQKKTPEERDDIFGDYKYKYQIVTKEQLNRLIIETGKPLYYLTFIKDSSNKIVCVTNAQTGKTIYSRGTSFSYNLKAGDIKDLNKEIN